MPQTATASADTATPKLLLVDDNDTFIMSLADGLRNDDLKVVTARNGAIALEMLGKHKVAMVITDLKMPTMDGFELLAAMSEKYSDIPVVVMTAYGTPQIDDYVQQYGQVVRYVEKPLDFEKVRKLIKEVMQASAAGYVQGLSLPGFIQVLSMERKTCTVSVEQDTEAGVLVMNSGQLVDATCGALHGLDAAYHILAWEKPRIEIKGFAGNNKTINQPVEQILMDAMRRKDEDARAGIQAPVISRPTAEPPRPSAPAIPSEATTRQRRPTDSTLATVGRFAEAQSLLSPANGYECWMVTNTDGQALAGTMDHAKYGDVMTFVANRAASLLPKLGLYPYRSLRVHLSDGRLLCMLKDSETITSILVERDVECSVLDSVIDRLTSQESG